MRTATIGVSLLAIAPALPVIAGDLNPPWWRGNPGTTFQH